tara:strand:- start:1252 stop:1470 length:219 start_codon:yes stop_codon:yes gene_type:complete
MDNSTTSSGMENFTMAELGVFLGVVGGVLTSLIFSIQKSKCDTIDCCGIRCHRKIPDEPNPDPPIPDPPVNP